MFIYVQPRSIFNMCAIVLNKFSRIYAAILF